MLKNKKILITGAAQGIGAATALKCAEQGASVIITDVNDTLGSIFAADMLSKGFNVVYKHLDVADEKKWQELALYIETTFGHIDGVVNNAGITGFSATGGPQDPENASLESWHHVHNVNLDGAFLGCKYGIRLLKQNGGSIVNMSSRSGIVGIPMAAAYASSKAAIRNHTKTVALWCTQNGYNIRCNSVHPAAILTPMWYDMFGENVEDGIKLISQDIPMRRMGKAEEVADTIAFLLSSNSSYITGSEFHIDGGILAGASAAPGKKD
jgi:3(or 17)beta-hydroxysteroid dehydrogenase